MAIEGLPVFLRRALAVALLALVLAGGWLLVARPILAERADLDERILEKRQLLGRYQAALATKAGQSAPSTGAAQPQAFLEGESEAIALANLQAMLAGLVSDSGARLRSARTLPARDRSDVRFIGTQLQLSGNIDAVQRLIHAIETRVPYLIVEGLQIVPTSAASGEVPASGTTGPQLDARIDVIGALARGKG
jgi:hypothetical protein